MSLSPSFANTTPPLVSIIIPCYNAEAYVGEAIWSALNQTYPECEVIVIDDGSTDSSLEVIKSFGKRVYWESGPNRGGCAARNRGAALAKGEYFQFLDADDVLDSNKIRHQVTTLRGDHRRVSTCRLIVSKDPSNERHKPKAIPSRELTGTRFLIEWFSGRLGALINPDGDTRITYGNSTSWLLPREIFNACGGWNEELAICQDSEFFARVTSVAKSIDLNSEAFGFYRIGIPHSVSAGTSRRKAESFLRYCQIVESLLRETRCDVNEAVAMLYVSFIQRFFPLHRDLVDLAFGAVAVTGVSAYRGIEAPRLRILCRFFGVRMALRIQKLKRGSS
jgi:glycosyltransferase involved in cell wall biosynthesis